MVSAKAEAASYQQLDFYSDGEQISYIKVGNYYFKQSSVSYATLCVSEQKSSGYINTGIQSYGAEWTNGKYVFYVSNNAIYRYNLSNGKSKKIKTLSSIACDYEYEPPAFSISLIYGNYIYITRSCSDEWMNTTYMYNKKTGKLKKILKNCVIEVSSGKYCIGVNEYQTEAVPRKITLYKITSSGSLKKVKVLGENTCGQWVVNGKFYYTKYENGMKTMSLYRCKLNGNGEKKLVTLSSSSNYIFIYNLTEKYFLYYDGGNKRSYYF